LIDREGNLIARSQLVNKPLAIFVYENGSLSADRLRYKHAVAITTGSKRRWMELHHF